MFRAVFFDRDGVLTEPNPEVRAAFRAQVEAWSGRPYAMDSDRMMRLFDAAGYPKGGLRGVAEELEFWLRYYERLLEEKGVREDRPARLLDMVWLRDRRCFPRSGRRWAGSERTGIESA